MLGKQFVHTIGLAVAGLIATVGLASAQVTEADVGINPTFEQTGPTTVTSTGGFFSGRAFVASASDFSGGTLTYAGSGSPQTLSYVPADMRGNMASGTLPFRTCKQPSRTAATRSI